MKIKLNLSALKNVIRELPGKDGHKIRCLVIPIKDNNLFEGAQGIYLDTMAFNIAAEKQRVENNNRTTHLVKQSLPKEVYDKMSEADRQAMPILGNVSVWEGTTAPPADSAAGSFADNAFADEKDDLPF